MSKITIEIINNAVWGESENGMMPLFVRLASRSIKITAPPDMSLVEVATELLRIFKESEEGQSGREAIHDNGGG